MFYFEEFASSKVLRGSVLIFCTLAGVGRVDDGRVYYNVYYILLLLFQI
jgi:hypothetical protein